jgi:hypothetical protein
MGDDASAINFNGLMLDRAGVMAALHERAARITGELDRVRIDCDLPCLADTLSLSARELHEHAVTALENHAAAPNVVPRLLTAFDALIRDVARVESSNVAEDGFPTHAQGRTLLRYLRLTFSDDANPGDRGAYVSRGGAGPPDSLLLVRLADGSTGRIDRDGQLST